MDIATSLFLSLVSIGLFVLIYLLVRWILTGVIFPQLSRHEISLAIDSMETSLEKQLKHYERARLYNPRDVRVYVGTGDILSKLNRDSDALAFYNVALELDPGCVPASYARGIVLHNLGNVEQALFVNEQARSLSLSSQNHRTPYKERSDEEEVRSFLGNVGFNCTNFQGEAGFLAEAIKKLWQQRFPRGLYIYVFLGVSLNQHSVQEIYQTAKEHSNYVLIIIDQQPELSAWGETNILRSRAGESRFVCLPMDIALIRVGIASGKEHTTLDLYIEKYLGRGFDPYDVRDPVSDAVSFFGRQPLTEDILEALQARQRIGLFGIHKMGKSSVLQQLQKRAMFPVAYVYLTVDDDLTRIYQQIFDDWQTNGRVKYPGFAWTIPRFSSATSFGRSEFDQVTKDLLNYLRSLTQAPPLLGIFLDEIEHIVPVSGEEKRLLTYTNLMDSLRGLQQETNSIVLLVAGTDPRIARQNYLWGTQKNPMYRVIVEQFLPPLSREDCTNMICSLGQQVNLQYEDSALESILEMSGCHPFFARSLCSLAYNKGRNGAIMTEQIVKTVVRNFIRDLSKTADFDEHGLWKELSLPEQWGEEIGRTNQVLLLKLANTDEGLSEDELFAGLDQSVAYTSLVALKERSIIMLVGDSQRYHITFGLFRLWIRSHQLAIE